MYKGVKVRNFTARQTVTRKKQIDTNDRKKKDTKDKEKNPSKIKEKSTTVKLFY